MLATRTRVPGTYQPSFGDVFGTYPASGFPSLENTGAVAKGMYRGPVPHGMLPRRLSGLGDTVDLAGYFGDIGAAGSVDSGGGGFWDTLNNYLPGLLKTGENIATARYAVPPPGTLIKTPTSMIYTQPTANQAAASGILTQGLLTGSSSLLPIVLIAAVALFAMKS
jgi:hypothetical protein